MERNNLGRIFITGTSGDSSWDNQIGFFDPAFMQQGITMNDNPNPPSVLRMNEGLFYQMRNGSTITLDAGTPGNITSNDMLEMIDSIFRNTPDITEKKERGIVLTTGLKGKLNFDWVMMYGETITVKNFFERFKYLKGLIYISLFEKHGKYKLKVNGNIISVYEGTKKIKEFTDCIHQWNMENNDIYNQKLIKSKLSEINTYLKKLENGRK